MIPVMIPMPMPIYMGGGGAFPGWGAVVVIVAVILLLCWAFLLILEWLTGYDSLVEVLQKHWQWLRSKRVFKSKQK